MKTYKLKLGNGVIQAKLNKFAKQADGAVMISYEDTTILSTAVMSKRDSNNNFFPLTINYEEKLYSIGKIPGNYGRREARPSDAATLTARLIDRPIRPLFPKGFKKEIQVVCSLMSFDHDYDADILAINGASIALSLSSNIPFEGPIGAVYIGMDLNGDFIINPNQAQKEDSPLELKMAGTLEEINMVEVKANELSEEVIIEAFMFGHEQIKTIVTWINEIKTDQNIVTEIYSNETKEGYEELKDKIFNDQRLAMKNAMCIKEKALRANEINALKTLFRETYNPQEDEEQQILVNNAYNDLEKDEFRRLVIKDKQRVDGRNVEEIRTLISEIDILPRAHGSSLFTRGETQALVVATLGVKSDEQTFDGLEPYDNKRFMLHYNFPPFSVGESGRMGAPGRREIGHGQLAEKALSIVMPSEEEFPYTVRLVSEILESNGSSSQASICGATLALQAAGVPIKKPVSGIAMGMVADSRGYTILTDIQGLEDHLGDMDFKVAGTADGICTIQMDIKIDGLSRQMLYDSLLQAKKARLEILDNMEATIPQPRKELSEFAPKMKYLKIEVKQIKDVIGKGGETINKIIEETNVKIDILEDGGVFIYSKDQEMIQRTVEIIEKLTKVYKVGEQYEAKVIRVESYGAFVVFNEQDGLLHISDLAEGRVEKVEDVVKLNDIITIEIKEIDASKRIKVKLVFEKEE
ncbi:MAG: polyribonucleotide nucleotidyltransferase [Spiroplasma sp.]|nr:polyribonucleotide nucleotidyltransferase [Mycoplasmatales bacterium]